MLIVYTIMFVLVALPLYALPATLSLPSGTRPGVAPLTIQTAARHLASTGFAGLPLVEAARQLVADRMQYSRRNSFERAAKAFARGYGYCQQQAFALADLLSYLGFDARVVYAFRNRLADGTITGHAWVRVDVDGDAYDIDTIHFDAAEQRLTFAPIGKVREYSTAFRILAGWGSAAVNAHRFYRTGKEFGK